MRHVRELYSVDSESRVLWRRRYTHTKKQLHIHNTKGNDYSQLNPERVIPLRMRSHKISARNAHDGGDDSGDDGGDDGGDQRWRLVRAAKAPDGKSNIRTTLLADRQCKLWRTSN